MSSDLQFRFKIQGLPEGKALTGSEIEQHLLDTLRAEDEHFLDALWSLGSHYQKCRKFDQSAQCIEHVINYVDDPEQKAAGHLALGQLEESRRDFKAAARRYRGAMAMEPCATQTWYFIHNNLGYCLNQTGEHEEAVPYLREALKINPDKTNAFKNLGLAFQGLGRFEEAAQMYVQATQVNAGDARSMKHLEQLLEANPALEVDVPELRGQLEACREAVQVARRSQPDFEAHWSELRKEQRGR